MATQVERGRGLEREGIQTDRVKWNLSAAALYEEAIRREEGVIAAEGPLTCLYGSAHRALAKRQVRRSTNRPARRTCWWGKVNRPHREEQLRRRCTATCLASLAGQGTLRSRLLCRRGPEVSPVGSRHHRIRLAQPVLQEPLHRRSGGRGGLVPTIHDHRFARTSRPIPSVTAPHPKRSSSSTSRRSWC